MTTYYDAPEPDDLQRRCWITDDGQCRLYNGHEGGHDFGGGEDFEADIVQAGMGGPDFTPKEWYATPEPSSEGRRRDRADLREQGVSLDDIDARLASGYAGFKHPLMVAVADVSALRALATSDRADPEHRMGPPRSEPGDAQDEWTNRCVACGAVWTANGCPNADRADPERRALSTDEWARLRAVDDIAREIVWGWDNGFPVADGQSESDLIDRLRPFLTEPQEPTALTPPPAGKAVLGTTTANELEEGK